MVRLRLQKVVLVHDECFTAPAVPEAPQRTTSCHYLLFAIRASLGLQDATGHLSLRPSSRSMSSTVMHRTPKSLHTSGIFTFGGPPLGFSSVTTAQEYTAAA